MQSRETPKSEKKKKKKKRKREHEAEELDKSLSTTTEVSEGHDTTGDAVVDDSTIKPKKKKSKKWQNLDTLLYIIMTCPK